MGRFEGTVFVGIFYFAIFMWTLEYTDSILISIVCIILFFVSLAFLENYFSKPKRKYEEIPIKEKKRKKRKKRRK
jgi:hypothetical protein